jgi:uncharacterized MnhB-related membrane protein
MNIEYADPKEERPNRVTDLLVQFSTLMLVGAASSALALTRWPLGSSATLSFQRLLLALAFLVLQAPDVELAQIVVGLIGLPLLVMLGVSELRRQKVKENQQSNSSGYQPRETDSSAGIIRRQKGRRSEAYTARSAQLI